MVSITTNFTLEELRHINMWITFPPKECKHCDSAKRKIVEAIELAEIAEEAQSGRIQA